MDLPVVGTVSSGYGWDLRGRFDDYTGHVPMTGKTFLDVGTASGFLSFEAEKRGAIVTSFDAESDHQIQYVPGSERDCMAELQGRRNSYWFSHRALNSKAVVRYGDIYCLGQLLPPYEIVFMGQILVHLRDPLEALHQASLIASETLIISEGSFESDRPTAVLVGGRAIPYAWWHLSNRIYHDWLGLLGFDVINETKSQYRCLAGGPMNEMVEVWTFVAKRRT
jgi:hypothetical protein